MSAVQLNSQDFFKQQISHVEHASPDHKASFDVEESVPNPLTQGTTRHPLPVELQGLSPEEIEHLNVKLRRKIDARLLPMLVIMYIMNYLDRNNIASARLGGLEDDLGLSSVQFQTTVSILFVGYLLMQLPSNLFLDAIGKPSIYLPTAMVIWGVISTATAACQGFVGLLICRFFLGFIEAAYFPGCLFFLSSWYTRKELSFRTAALYSGALISGAFSGLIAAGVVDGMDGLHGLRAWRWLFIIEGALTVGIAFLAIWILPDFPATTKWLTPQERALAIYRLEIDAGEVDADRGHGAGAKMKFLMKGGALAFKDIRTYMLMVVLLGIVSSGGVTNFFPTVVATLGYNRVNSLLLTAPPYVLAVACTFFNAWHADRTGERFLHIAIPLCISIAAFIIAACTIKLAPRYLSMMLMVPSVYSAFVVALAWISNSMPRPPAKRAAALAFINAVSNGSSIYVSYLYPLSDSPRYQMAMGVNAGTAAVSICMAFGLRTLLRKMNRQLESAEMGEFGATGEVPGGGGVSVEQAKSGFRYLT